jgi:predicted acyl esterase
MHAAPSKPQDRTFGHNGFLDFVNAAAAGFAVVFQDTHGRTQSEGEFYPYIHDGERPSYITLPVIPR